MSKVRLGSYGAFWLAVHVVCALVFLASCGDSDSSNNAEPQFGSFDGPVVQDSIDSPAVDTLGQNNPRDTLKTSDSLFHETTHLDSLKGKDTSEVVIQDTSVKKDPTLMENVTVTGTFGYGILDSRSTVAVQALDETFAPNGYAFSAVVNAGTYTAANVNFRPPYARAIVLGNVTDLVHGGTITPKDTLYALVAGTGNGGVANINVLTYLKSVYMQNLLKVPGYTEALASDAASTAVWNMFGFDAAALGQVDSITSFAAGEAGAALLAVTIMMQALDKDSVANLWKVAADFADGAWDDSVSRAKIADWAFGVDLENEFEIVRRNVQKLGLGSVPEFEKYIRAFYMSELGIPACNEENGGKVVFSQNPASGYYASEYSDVSVTSERYICDSRDLVWREATDREKDVYGLQAGSDGEIRQGLINAGNLYRYGNGGWRAVTSNVDIDAYFVDKSNITDFVDIKQVYDGIKDDERVIFVLRHGQRDQNATSKNSGLTQAGIDSAKYVGSKLTKFSEPMRLGASEFYRAQQTVIAIAQGRDQDTTISDTIPELNDDWYMIDRELVNRAESDAGGGWEATSLYTYTGKYSGDTARIEAYYNLEERSAELIELLLDKYQNEPDRFIMLSSHDKLMVPFVAYCSKLRINMNIKNGGTWINYFAGIAIIWDKAGNRRYVAFKGLRDAYFRGW